MENYTADQIYEDRDLRYPEFSDVYDEFAPQYVSARVSTTPPHTARNRPNIDNGKSRRVLAPPRGMIVPSRGDTREHMCGQIIDITAMNILMVFIFIVIVFICIMMRLTFELHSAIKEFSRVASRNG